jgi:hypothetical protein
MISLTFFFARLLSGTSFHTDLYRFEWIESLRLVEVIQ